MTSAAVLRVDAVVLALFGLSGLTLDLVGYAAGVGPTGPLLRDNPLAIGVVEAHGLAVVLAVMLFRSASRPAVVEWHVVAVTVHAFLGVCNLAFWDVFRLLAIEPVGVVTTSLHVALVAANLAALRLRARPARAPRRRAREPVR